MYVIKRTVDSQMFINIWSFDKILNTMKKLQKQFNSIYSNLYRKKKKQQHNCSKLNNLILFCNLILNLKIYNLKLKLFIHLSPWSRCLNSSTEYWRVVLILRICSHYNESQLSIQIQWPLFRLMNVWCMEYICSYIQQIYCKNPHHLLWGSSNINRVVFCF